mmetsp:Transcript_69329/g.195699  ORF Transcript_69329/g.195699 Transcript_69329/m.195699 type:complete len:349 (+) Transcript_69329:113-1159(+)
MGGEGVRAPGAKRAKCAVVGCMTMKRGSGDLCAPHRGRLAPTKPRDFAKENARRKDPATRAKSEHNRLHLSTNTSESSTTMAKDMKKCDACVDESVPASEGVMCPAKTHFLCNVCLQSYLGSFKSGDYAVQKKCKGRILCPFKDSETPFGDGPLVAHVPQDVFDDYLEIRIKVAETGIQEQMEKENNDKINELKEKLAKATGSGEQLEIDKHRLRIIDDIFTLKCPKCKLAFLDYDNCSAISCAGCKCGFCSFCLEDCGADAHQHFYKNKSKCPKEGGPLFIDHAKWLVYQRKRKTKIMGHCLASVPQAFLLHDKLLSIMSELSLQALRQKICDSVAREARDLGITMP